MVLLVFLFAFFSCSQKEVAVPKNKKQVDSVFKKANSLVEKNDDNNAFYLYNLAKDEYLQLKDSMAAARCLTEMAVIQEYNGDNLGSIETSIAALKLVHENNNKHYEIIFDNYTNLGTNSTSLKKYEEAEKSFVQSLQFATQNLQWLRTNHNLALILFLEKKYDKAKEIQEIVLREIPKNNENYYKILINFARYSWHYNPNVNPVTSYEVAENHYKSTNDNWGLAATYCYFSEYYEDKNNDLAVFYSHKMFEVAKKINSTLDELEALEKILRLDKSSQKYLPIYLNKSDSLKLTENKSKNQFAIIRYDSEKNNSKNIKLEKVINQKNDWIFFLLFLSLLTLFSSFMWVKYRRKKIKFIAESKVKEERLITSKKVHDVVANGLYQLMSSVENNQDIDKELLLDKLEIMYQKSRDISYNDQLKLSNINIKNQISELGDTFQNENLKVFIVGNEESLWKKISSSIQEDLYIILQELFINTKKHSQATRIVLKFSLEKKQLIINYNDNGICPKDYNLGNGLTHILNRIQQNKGELILPNENVPNSEFKISIIIPVLY